MGKRKTVLVVDDSAVQLEELVTAFEDEGYAVGAASWPRCAPPPARRGRSRSAA